MNIEIANKLQKLRKENGYSQEQLAIELGISRQAVSKWERAESSPDTDNLICLAKLYGISLDELLATDETIEEIRDDVILNAEKDETDDGDEYNSMTKSQKLIISIFNFLPMALLTIAYITIGIKLKIWHPTWILFLLIPIFSSLGMVIVTKDASKFAYPILVLVLYLFFSFQYSIFHPLWVIFLTIPIYYSLCELINKHKQEKNK